MKNNIIKVMKILIPFTPHLAHECLELLGTNNVSKWPAVDKKLIDKEKIKIAVQLNGRTKTILEVEKNIIQNDVVEICKKNVKMSRNLANSKIKKTIFVKNKIINFIIEIK